MSNKNPETHTGIQDEDQKCKAARPLEIKCVATTACPLWLTSGLALHSGLQASFIKISLQDSDLEAEPLREDSLHLSAICFWCFSLAAFIILAKSLAHSEAFLLFLLHCFFGAIHRISIAGHVE